MHLPSFDSYGNTENTLRFYIGPITIWYSYKTPVAFQVDGGPQRVLNYTESKTTFKHLNMIDGGNREARLSHAEFQKLWDKEVAPRIKS